MEEEIRGQGGGREGEKETQGQKGRYSGRGRSGLEGRGSSGRHTRL